MTLVTVNISGFSLVLSLSWEEDRLKLGLLTNYKISEIILANVTK